MSFTSEEIDNFWKDVEKTHRKDGVPHCWLWHGKHTTLGYGIFQTDDTHYAHRFSYMIHKGKIPKNLVIDHLCEIRSCVNPDHLELVSQKENVHRISSRQNTLQYIYDRTNQEYDIPKNARPVLPRVKQCACALGSCFDLIGMGKFPDVPAEQIHDKVVVDMLSTMLSNKFIIFQDRDPEELINGYKRKYFWSFVQYQIDWFGDVSMRELLEYYSPHLIDIGWDRFGHCNMENNIIDFIEHLEFLELTSPHQLKREIKDKLDDVNKLIVRYEKLYKRMLS